MKKMLYFVNPAAGREEMRHQLMDVINYFTANGYDVLCHPTQRQRDITDYIAAHGEQYDLIVSCGGDGTLNETVSGLMQLENRPLLGYIPAGTVNDFASSLHIPKNITGAVHNIINGVPTAVDMGRFNDQYFTYVAAFGAFTKVSYETPHASKHVLGRAAYLIEGVRSLSDIHPIHVTVETADKTVEDDVLLGMVTNATSVGGFKLRDDGLVKMDDGLNEVILVKAPSGLSDYNGLLGCLASRNFDPQYFHVLQTDELTMRFSEPTAWTLDGEFGGVHSEVRISNIATPVSILAPQQQRVSER